MRTLLRQVGVLLILWVMLYRTSEVCGSSTNLFLPSHKGRTLSNLDATKVSSLRIHFLQVAQNSKPFNHLKQLIRAAPSRLLFAVPTFVVYSVPPTGAVDSAKVSADDRKVVLDQWQRSNVINRQAALLTKAMASTEYPSLEPARTPPRVNMWIGSTSPGSAGHRIRVAVNSASSSSRNRLGLNGNALFRLKF